MDINSVEYIANYQCLYKGTKIFIQCLITKQLQNVSMHGLTQNADVNSQGQLQRECTVHRETQERSKNYVSTHV